MAKVNGPLLSLSARGQLGKALVYSGWKGLHTVRQHVIPANPQTSAQVAQRGKLTAAVADIHAAEIAPANPLNAVDIAAYAAWANQQNAPLTWFNQACKNHIDVAVLGNVPTTFRGAVITPAAAQVTLLGYSDEIGSGDLLAATIYYGISPTALIQSTAATINLGASSWTKAIAGLVAGTKYYFQLVANVADPCEGARSGIFTGTPT